MTENRRLKSITLVVVLTAIVYVFTIAIFYGVVQTLYEPRTFTLAATVLSLSAIGFVTLYSWIKDRARYVDTITQELNVYKRIVGMKTHTYHIMNSKKEFKILNDKGDAEINISLMCQNTSARQIDHISLRIFHDGNILEDSLRCEINGHEVQPTDVKCILSVDAKTKEEIASMPRTLMFKILPKKGEITPDARFDYSYSYTAKEMFPRITEEYQEFSQTFILHPNSRLNIAFEAPEDYVFSKKIKIEVFDRNDTKHAKEEKRVMSECPPLLLNKRKLLLWTVTNPLLASKYRIRFSIEH